MGSSPIDGGGSGGRWEDVVELTDHDPYRLLTAAEVAELLAVPKSWVYAETRAGRLPHVKLGRYYRYAPDSIAAFIADLERGPVPYRKYGEPTRRKPEDGGDD
jgi:excisionase family DNA binding protein